MARVALSFVVLAIMMLGLKSSEGVTYNVGDATGWSTPTNPEFYDNWSDGKIFRVGDVLSFTWAGVHNVAKVTEAQYDACTTTVPNAMTTSPATFTLSTVGNHYFICTVSTHCTQGQKLDIEVVAGNTTTPATSPPTTPTPATPGASTPPTTTTPTSGSSPPPPSANSSGSFGPIVAISAILSAVVFAFMC